MSTMSQQVTEAYLAECSRTGNGLATLLDQVDVPAARLGAWRPLPRPMFADEAELRAFGADLTAVFHLLTDLPARCFDGDLARFCAALRIDERRAGLMRRLGDTPPPLYGRSDMYHDGTAFRLLEFNIGSAVGGLDLVGSLPAAMLRVPDFARFAAAHDLRPHDTGADVARALRTAARPVAADPVVAILEGPGGLASYGHQRRALAEQLGGHGLRCLVGELGDLKFTGGKPYLDGTPVDLVLRYFALEEMLGHPDADALLDPVFRAHRDGSVVLWTPMSSNLYGNKGTLAMLSELAADSSTFSAAERQLVDRVVPWSRLLGRPGATAEADLIEECLDHRDDLVLKPTGLYGGQGVLIGAETDERTWRQAVLDGAADGCLVQRRVAPGIEPVTDPGTGVTSGWQILWGAFLTPDGFAGASVRAVPPGSTAVISLGANRDTRNTCVFLC